jgi:hypothetical protein
MTEKFDSIVNALRSKIGSAAALKTIFTHEHMQAAQQLIEHTKDSYFDTIEEMNTIFQNAAQGNFEPKAIYTATKSLKAQSEGLGFVFLMEVSDSLYKFLQERAADSDAPPVFDKSDTIIVRKHAEAIISTIVKRERGKGGIVEADILNGLKLLKSKLR